MLTFRVIEYGSSEYKQMVALRDIVLRQPLGLSYSKEYLEQEINDQLLGCFVNKEENEILCGCCILTPVNKDMIQLRQMAVDPEQQRSGIGRQLIEFAEQQAMRDNFTQVMLHARDVAVGFYQKLGYHVQGDGFTEVGILHYEMTKRLKPL
jgi:ribosomal protein S18 acetylase RimI-like enzyme